MSESLVFTIDVEEWFHSENIAPVWNGEYSKHTSLPLVYQILALLEKKGAKGTFFFLGTIAKKNKKLVLDVARKGHEIASHGWDHKLIHTLSKCELQHDIRKSTEILEQITGEKVLGYRSPCFSQSNYLVDTLLENGYAYTSNGIRSTLHDRYANNNIVDKRLHDFGLPVAELLGFNMPATGGGWFRLLPLNLQRVLTYRSNQSPKVFYAHPVDFDCSLPKLHFVGNVNRFRQTINTSGALKKLQRLEFTDKPLKSFMT